MGNFVVVVASFRFVSFVGSRASTMYNNSTCCLWQEILLKLIYILFLPTETEQKQILSRVSIMKIFKIFSV